MIGVPVRRRGLPPHPCILALALSSLPLFIPDRFQATGCQVPIECGQEGLILGQLQGLAIALCCGLVVLELEMPVPLLLQLHCFCLGHLWGQEELRLASPSLQTRGWVPGLRSGAPGAPSTRMRGEDAACNGPTPSTRESFSQKDITAFARSVARVERGLGDPVPRELCSILCNNLNGKRI